MLVSKKRSRYARKYAEWLSSRAASIAGKEQIYCYLPGTELAPPFYEKQPMSATGRSSRKGAKVFFGRCLHFLRGIPTA
jgi:hypothetical protein